MQNKGLDSHVQPGKQKSFPIQTVNKGMPTHPIPKPRIGQGRAGLRRKVKVSQPIASPHLLPIQPIIEHDSRTAVPLPEPTNQSQSHVQFQILPRQLSQHHPTDPTHIPQQKKAIKSNIGQLHLIMIPVPDLHQNLLMYQIL